MAGWSTKRNHIWSPMLFMLEKWKYTSLMNVIMNSTRLEPRIWAFDSVADGPHVSKKHGTCSELQKCAMRGKQRNS